MTSYGVIGDVIPRRKGIPVLISSLMVVIMAIIMSFSLFIASGSAIAFFDSAFCGTDLGSNTAYSSSDGGLVDDDTIMSKGGKYSIMDLYGSTIQWTTFNGNIGKNGFKDTSRFNKKNLSGVKTSGTEESNVKAAAEDSRTFTHCVGSWMGSGFGNMFLAISNLITKFMGWFVGWAVNPKFICQDAANPGTGCINLLGIIGGTGGSNGGIIGTLYQNVYLNLVSLVIIIVAVWMLMKLIKGSIRESLFGIIWAVIAVFLGVMALSNPVLIAEAPMKLSLELGSCVSQAMNGNSCISTSTDTSLSVNQDADVCLINPTNSVDFNQMLALNARMSTCKLWKAFVLEPWSQGQFGMSFESLDTSNSDLITQSPSSKSLAYWKKIKMSMTGTSKTAICTDTTGNKFSNIALYQLDLMSDVHGCNGSGTGSYHSATTISGRSDVYNDWYYIIDIMSQARADTGSGSKNISHSWNEWSGFQSRDRMSLGLVAIIAAIAAATIIIPAALRTMMYMIIGTLLTVLSPLFMLAAIHPTTGRRVFLGWLEQELGAVMKYFFMMIWIAIVVEIYGAILGSSTNSVSTFVFVIAISATLKAYQPQLLELFGKIDLGGQKLTGGIGDRMEKKFGSMGANAKMLGKARLGGAVAGLANGSGGLKSRMVNAHDVGKDQMRRQGAMMGGALGSAFQASNAIHDKNAREAQAEIERQNQQADDTATNAEQKASDEFNVAADEQSKGVSGVSVSSATAASDLAAAEAAQRAAINGKSEYKGVDEVAKARTDAIDAHDSQLSSTTVTSSLTKGTNGVYMANTSTMTPRDAAAANEAAYRKNSAARANILASAHHNSNGDVQLSAEQQKQVDDINAQLNSSSVSTAHTDWQADTQLAGNRAAEREFMTQQAAGNIDSSVTSAQDAAEMYSQKQDDLNRLNEKVSHTSAGIAAYNAYKTDSADAVILRNAANHIKEVNRQGTDRPGRSWSTREVKKMKDRGAALDAVFATGNARAIGAEANKAKRV